MSSQDYAPSIFQRTLDNILRQYIRKICYVYIDDIIIFSKDENTHSEHIVQIFDTLCKANMNVPADKYELYKNQVELLGLIVFYAGCKTLKDLG